MKYIPIFIAILLLFSGCERKPMIARITGSGSGSETPEAITISPNPVVIGQEATINGANFGNTPGKIMMGDVSVISISFWSNNTIKFIVPQYANKNLTIYTKYGICEITNLKISETITITEWGKWIPTRIIVKKDQTFTVTATGGLTGYINGMPWLIIFTPSGLPGPGSQCYPGGSSYSFIPNENAGILVGRIGLTTPYILGASYTGISLSDGVLELGINNSTGCTLVSGSYIVTITVE